MNKLIVYENTTCQLEQADLSLIDTLLTMSAEIKDSLGLQYQPIQFISGNSIRVERIIGNISLNDVNLVVVPKVLIAPDNDEALSTKLKAFLLRTLKSAGDRLGSTVYFTKNSLADDQGLLLEVLAQYYYESLSRAVMLSAISTYESVEQKSTVVRGRILVQKQLSEPMNDAKIWCRYKRISTDNSYNALLVWACSFFASSVQNVALKKRLFQLIQEIGFQSEELTHQIVAGLHLPRQFSVYKESFSVAQNLFLKQAGKKQTGLGSHICGYVVSTERAFEQIVEAYCRKAAVSLGYEHRAQATTRLAKASVGKEYDYYIIPDDLVFTNEKRLVVDAKYKILHNSGTRNKPIRDDIYQMISSCIAHNAFEAVLVYPEAMGVVPITWKVVEKINGNNYIISSAFVDVFSTDEVLLAGMVRLLEKTAFHGVIA